MGRARDRPFAVLAAANCELCEECGRARRYECGHVTCVRCAKDGASGLACKVCRHDRAIGAHATVGLHARAHFDALWAAVRECADEEVPTANFSQTWRAAAVRRARLPELEARVAALGHRLARRMLGDRPLFAVEIAAPERVFASRWGDALEFSFGVASALPPPGAAPEVDEQGHAAIGATALDRLKRVCEGVWAVAFPDGGSGDFEWMEFSRDALAEPVEGAPAPQPIATGVERALGRRAGAPPQPPAGRALVARDATGRAHCVAPRAGANTRAGELLATLARLPTALGAAANVLCGEYGVAPGGWAHVPLEPLAAAAVEAWAALAGGPAELDVRGERLARPAIELLKDQLALRLPDEPGLLADVLASREDYAGPSPCDCAACRQSRSAPPPLPPPPPPPPPVPV